MNVDKLYQNRYILREAGANPRNNWWIMIVSVIFVLLNYIGMIVAVDHERDALEMAILLDNNHEAVKLKLAECERNRDEESIDSLLEQTVQAEHELLLEQPRRVAEKLFTDVLA